VLLIGLSFLPKLYRSKRHAGRKRNFRIMSRARWLEMRLRYVRDYAAHLARYCDW
jgi:hypothetical protein